MQQNFSRLVKGLFLLVSSTIVPSIAMAGDVDKKPGALEQLNLDQYQGKVVYVDFWASWCGPCRQSFPVMNELQETYGGENFVIIAINEDSEAGAAEQFLKRYPANFKIFYDQNGELAEYFKVDAMPTSYLLDQTGAAKYRHRGFRQKDVSVIHDQIQTLLTDTTITSNSTALSNTGDPE